jgi:LysM repeat protein
MKKFVFIVMILVANTGFGAVYIVRKNDTLSEIALKTRSDVRTIAKINDLFEDRIFEGQRLYIPERVISYRIQSGDTLSAIALAHSSKVEHIILFNNLANEMLYVGQNISIPVVKDTNFDESAFSQRENINPQERKITHTVRAGETLSHIAQRYGVSVADILRWNNKNSDIVFVGENLILYVNNPNTVIERPAEPIPKERLEGQNTVLVNYEVVSGDNLSVIARRFSVSVDDLMRWNNKQNDIVFVGERLKIFTDPNVASSANNASQNTVIYEVKRGDNLSTIAQRYGVPVADIIRWNNKRNDTIYIGERLTLHTDNNPAARTSAPVTPQSRDNRVKRVYTVQRGDNLTQIARRHNVSVEDLVKWNNKSVDTVFAGETLTVYVERGNTPSELKNNEKNVTGNFTFPIQHKYIKCVESTRRGIIITLDRKTDIKSAGSGIVEYSGYMRGFNNVVIVRYSAELIIVYAYLSEINVGENDRVAKGQPLGKVDYLSYYDKIQLYMEIRRGENMDLLKVEDVFPLLKDVQHVSRN